MASSVHQFFSAQAHQLRDGRIVELARGYSVPLVVALPDTDPGYVVLSTRHEIEHFFQLKYDGLLSAGISYLPVEVTGVRTTTGDRLTAEVEWYYLGADGNREGRTTARYFLERLEGALSVQMIEFKRIALPAIVAWFQEAGEPARQPPGIMLH